MAVQFEGDIEDHIKRFTESILISRGLNNCTVKVEPVGKLGDNYSSTVKRIIVETYSKSEKLQMVLKISPTEEWFRQSMNVIILFRNEIVIYNELIPKYQSLERFAGVPVAEKVRFPNCYGTSTKSPGEIIMLEDLEVSGFKMLNKYASLRNSEIILTVKELGKLHALSFVLKQKDPVFFENIIKKLTNVWELNAENKGFLEMVKLLEIAAMSAIENDGCRNYLKGSVLDVPKYAISSSAFDKKSEDAVIMQGDCWTNNVLFRFEEEQPKEVVLIDYQMGMVGSPVIELMYLIFNCTDYETRSKHYYDWLQHYYKSFEQYLLFFGLNATDLYTREKMDEDLKRHSKFSFGSYVLMINMLIRKDDEVVDFRDKSQEEVQKMTDNTENFNPLKLKPETQKLFKMKIDEIIKSYVEFGYITE